jgi:hypothetical protein
MARFLFFIDSLSASIGRAFAWLILIVPRLSGGIVATARSNADTVVTER